jgi:probable HAF family extracellular repeat protein
LASLSFSQGTYKWLKVPTDGTFGLPIAISSNGIVLGYDKTGYFTWSPHQGRNSIRVGGLEGEVSLLPNAVNALGQVVGEYSLGHGSSHAFIWYPTGKFRDLGTLGGSYANAYGINDLGEIVGASQTPSGQQHAFTWSVDAPWNGRMRDESAEHPFQASLALTVNKYGAVVGQFSGQGVFNKPLACEWVQSGNGAPTSFKATLATGINSSGAVVGWNQKSQECFFWSGITGYVAFGEGFFEQAQVYVNDKEEVVGGNELTPGFFWSPSTGFRALQSLVAPGTVNLGNAYGIDNNGDILASGGENGSGKIFVLYPDRQSY